jgi:hypothetical protein
MGLGEPQRQAFICLNHSSIYLAFARAAIHISSKHDED